MKAVVLAGGYGKRLRPLTDDKCKPMVLLGEKPLASYVVESLVSSGIVDLIFATGYRADDVENYFGDGKRFGAHITYSRENSPLGTAGAVRRLKDVLGDRFLVVPADGFSDVDLKAFSEVKLNGLVGALAVCEKEVTTGLGVVDFGADGLLSEFVEKPQISTKSYVNTGIYMFSIKVFDYIHDSVCDFGRDVLPLLCNKMKVYVHRGYWSDVGTVENLMAAETFLKKAKN